MAHAAWLYSYVGEFAAATPLADEALALARDRGDEWVIAHVLTTLGGHAMSQGEPLRARALLEDARARFHALGDAWGAFASLTELGIVAMDSDDYDAALDYFTRVGVIVDERHLTGSYRAHVLVNLADTYRGLGTFGEVEVLCEEVLAMPDLAKQPAIAVANHNLGHVFMHRGNVSRAADLIRQSLDVFWQTGDWWNVATLLESSAEVMHVYGDSTSSVRSYAAACALREAMPYPLSAAQQADVDQKLQASRQALGQGAYAVTWTTGRNEPLAEAVAHARGVLTAIANRPETPP